MYYSLQCNIGRSVQHFQRINFCTRHASSSLILLMSSPPHTNFFSMLLLMCTCSVLLLLLLDWCISVLHWTALHCDSFTLTIPAFGVPCARIPPQWPNRRMCMNSLFLIYLPESLPEFHTHNSENTAVQTVPKMCQKSKWAWSKWKVAVTFLPSKNVLWNPQHAVKQIFG